MDFFFALEVSCLLLEGRVTGGSSSESFITPWLISSDYQLHLCKLQRAVGKLRGKNGSERRNDEMRNEAMRTESWATGEEIEKRSDSALCTVLL